MSFENNEWQQRPKEWWEVVTMNRWEIAQERQKIRDSIKDFSEEKYAQQLQAAIRQYQAHNTDKTTKALDAARTIISSKMDEPLFRVGEVVRIPVEELLQERYAATLNRTVDVNMVRAMAPEEANAFLSEGWIIMDPQPDKNGKIGVTKSFPRTHGGTATSAGIMMSVPEVSVASEEYLQKKA